MKKGIFSMLLALVLIAVIAISICGCSGKEGPKAMSLENGWSINSEVSEASDKELAKGFVSEEQKALSELTLNTQQAVCYSNTFNGDLKASGNETAVLDIYDASGQITVWLNGKEVVAEIMEAGKCSFDVTEAAKNGKNTLVIKASPQGNDNMVSPGSMINIAVHSDVFVADAYTVSDTENGLLKVFAVVNNTTEEEQTLALKADIASMDNNVVTANYSETVTVPAGESTVEFEFNGSDLINWSNENPFLYMLTIKLNGEMYSDYIGYKSFEMNEEGSFLINGQPIFIKAADITEDECYAENLYEILNYVKVAGFNTVHVKDGVATARLLEYCDRLGLLVYEGATDTSVELAKRDRSHVSLCMADGNVSAWKDSGAQVAVIADSSVVNSLGDEIKHYIFEANIDASFGEEGLMGIKTMDGKNSFIKSVGVTGSKDNVLDISLAKEWYEAFGIDSVMAMGEINDVINNSNVKDNAHLLDYVRNKEISGLCFTTDISLKKTDLTEIINDSINDLRFTIITDRSNAFDTDKIKLNVNLSNYGVLTEGKYDVIVKVTGQGKSPFEKTVTVEIDPEKTVQEIFEGEISLKGYEAGEYVISAEFYKNAHATCGDKTILVHKKSALPKLTGKVYTLGVENSGLVNLLKEQGATVEKFTGTQKGVIVIGENFNDTALLEKAYENGTRVIVLGAQNKEKLPVEGIVTQNMESVFVLHNSSLTENAVDVNSIYRVGLGGYIVTDSRFETTLEAQRALSSFNVNEDGSVTAGNVFALYEDKYVISTMALEFNLSNPYAALMLLNAIK